MTDLMGWASTALHLFAGAAFAIVCLVRMRRIGVAPAVMLAGVGILKIVLVITWRVFVLAIGHAPYHTMEVGLRLLGAVGVLANLVDAALVGVAFFLARNPPRGA